MMESKTGEKKSKSPVLIGVSLAVFVSAILSFFLGQGGILRLRELEAEYDHVRLENYRLALENKKTAEEIRKLRTDPAIVEKIAREELHFVSPHDVVLIVPEPEEEATSEETGQ
jgi:cell division protein FtsB